MADRVHRGPVDSDLPLVTGVDVPPEEVDRHAVAFLQPFAHDVDDLPVLEPGGLIRSKSRRLEFLDGGAPPRRQAFGIEARVRFGRPRDGFLQRVHVRQLPFHRLGIAHRPE